MGSGFVNEINWKAPALAKAEQGLDPELRDAFRSLVESCTFHAVKRGWHPVRQWEVLADLIREGWSGPPCSAENRPQAAGEVLNG